MQTQPEYIPTLDATQATVYEMFASILQQRLQAGAMEQAITKQVNQLIEQAASDAFRSYNDLGKAISKQLTAAMMPNIEELEDLPSYHHFVTNRIKQAAQDFYDTRLAEALDKELAEIMGEVPEQITMSWLVEQLVSEVRDSGYSRGERITFTAEERRYGSLLVYLDKDEGVKPNSCAIKLHLSLDDKTGKYAMLSIEADRNTPNNPLVKRRIYGLEKKLFNIFATKGQIDLDQGTDPDNYDTYCGHDD